MQQNSFYCCHLKPISASEADLVYKFWELGNEKTYPYRYRLQELAQEFGMQSTNDVAIFAAEHSFISSNSQSYKCLKCNTRTLIKGRTEFTRFLKKTKPELCEHCKKEQVNKIAIEKVVNLTSLTGSLSLPTFNEHDFQSLSYLNKIVLTAMLLEMDSSNEQPLQITKDELMLSGSNENDEKILRELFSKGAIHVVDENKTNQHPLLNEIRCYLEKNFDLIDDETIDKFNICSRQVPRQGLYFLVPEKFDELDEYRAYLYEEVMCAEVSKADIESIKELVMNNRLNLAYTLLNIAREETNVPVDLNTKLDSVLLNLIRQHPLPLAYNIIHYQAERVASVLFSKPTLPGYIQNKLLAKKIEEHLKHLEENENSPKYSKKIPDIIVGSKIEHFCSHCILGDQMSWTYLSGNEIINKWLNSTTVRLTA